MAVPADRLLSLLAYCRVEEPTEEEQLTLTGLYDTAVGYMDAAGVSQPPEGTARRAQYDQCVNFMVLRDFDLRSGLIDPSGAVAHENPAFRALLNQLKLTELPPSEGGG